MGDAQWHVDVNEVGSGHYAGQVWFSISKDVLWVSFLTSEHRGE